MLTTVKTRVKIISLCQAKSKAVSPQTVTPNFHSWASQKGIVYPKLEVGIFEDGLRGMRALESIEKDEILVQLPRNIAMEIDPSTKCLNTCPPHVWEKQKWYVKLALRLMSEKAKGDKSAFSGYISSLPSEIDTPMFWPSEDLQRIGYPFFIRSVEKQKEEWHQLFQTLRTECPTLELNKSEFFKSLAFVQSRSFSGPYIGSKLSDRLYLAAIVIFLAIGNVLLNGLDSLERTFNAVIAVFSFNLLYELSLSQRLKVYLLAPGVDLMNHSCSVKCDLSYNYFSDGYSVRSDKDYAQGEQVYISYGKKSNEDLLQYFGFIEENNPNDCVIVEQGLKKLHKIFTSMTNSKASWNQDTKNVLIYREGFASEVVNELSKWIREENLPNNFASQTLTYFCQQESKTYQLSREQLSWVQTNSRHKLIDSFLTEKISILKTCIAALERNSK